MLDTGDATVSFLDQGGTGQPLVFLHGLAGSAKEWIRTAEAFSDYRCILVDQRGHGHSTRRPDDTSREAFVHDVVQVIESVSDAPVVLVGQSMGAHTAMLTAAARPDLIDRLVLLECGAGSDKGEQSDAVGEYFKSWPIPFRDLNEARTFLGRGALADAWIQDLDHRESGYFPRFDADVVVKTSSAMSVPRWTEWEAVTAPTLAVYAENGMFSEAAKDEFVRRGRNAHRVDIAGASHDAHLDALAEWVRILRIFLTETEHFAATGPL